MKEKEMEKKTKQKTQSRHTAEKLNELSSWYYVRREDLDSSKPRY